MWKTTIDERLSNWHEFRISLNSLPLNQALEKTAKLWSNAPFKTFYLDPTDLTTWPDPWELITQNHYCELAKCLGIIYTIYFTNHNKDLTLEIRLYQDITACQLYSLVYINNGEYILNWSAGEIVNTTQIEKNQLQFLQGFSNTDLVLEKY